MTRRTVPLAPETRALLATANELLAGATGHLVGGSLRDALLDRPCYDIDLAVPGGAPGFARSLADRLGGHYVLLDAERGTARVVLPARREGGDEGPVRIIDVARLRGGSIEADLAERDFTVDALAVPLDALAAS